MKITVLSVSGVDGCSHIPAKTFFKIYSLFLLMPNSDKIRHVSWYYESQLTLIKKRTLAGIECVEKLLRNE